MASGSKKKSDESQKMMSRKSARECRTRKKMRYQYLEELITCREKAVFELRKELEMFKQWCIAADKSGSIPLEALVHIAEMNKKIEGATAQGTSTKDEEADDLVDLDFINQLLSADCMNQQTNV